MLVCLDAKETFLGGDERLEQGESLWRNWLARSAVNRKVDGSNPSRDGFFDKYFFNKS